MASKAPEVHRMSATEGAGNGRNIAIDCKGKLDDGEVMTGSVTIPAVTGLTFSNAAVSTATKTINNRSVPAGEAIQFNVKGTATGTYEIIASAPTNATPAQTVDAKIVLIIES